MISKDRFNKEVQDIVTQLIRVYKPEEVKERLRLGDPFIKSIFEEGKVLYDAS